MRNIVLILLLTSCVSKKACERKYPPQVIIKDSVHVHTIRKDSIIKGATVTNTIWKDSVAYYPAYKIFTVKDTSGLAELRYYKDAYGNIVASCQANDRVIEMMRQYAERFEKRDATHVKEVRYIPWWIWVLFGGLAALTIAFRLR